MKGYFGKSMFGGWYLNVVENGLYNYELCKNFNTLKELKKFAKNNKIELRKGL